MEGLIGWFQPEHKGRALDTWQSAYLTFVKEKESKLIRNPNLTPSQALASAGVGYWGNPENGLAALGLNAPRALNDDMRTLAISNSHQSAFAILSKVSNQNHQAENRASTFSLDHNPDLIRKYGGCPWRESRPHYSPGIEG
jgi:hypothetical protein